MAKPEKVAAVAELTEEFRQSNAVVLTEYRGLTVKQLTALRRALGEGSSYTVAKNTLAKIAAKDAGIDGIDDVLKGPSGIAFVKGDVVEAAKGIRAFAKDHPLLVVKGGVLDGKPLSAEDVKKLADLESREVLLAKAAGAMKASMGQAVALFAAPLSKMARTAEALREAAEANPSLLAGGAGVPAAAAAPAEETAVEASAPETDSAEA